MENYGNLLYYTKRNKPVDPFNGLKVVYRLGKRHSSLNSITFEVPEDKLPLKIDKNMLDFELIMPSNYIPDNDVAAKMVNKMTISVLDTVIFSSFTEGLEYTFFNHFLKKLNYSPQAQEVELFHEGHYDSFDIDSRDLPSTSLINVDKNCVENRQQYASQLWKKSEKASEKLIKLGTTNEAVEHEILYNVYKIRAPLAHGLARQPCVLPPGSKVIFDVNLSSSKKMIMRHDKYIKCRVRDPTLIIDYANLCWPYNGSTDPNSPILMEEITELHESYAACTCHTTAAGQTEDRLTTNEYHQLEDVYPSKDDLDKTKWILATTFRPHYAKKTVPKVRRERFPGDDHEYGVFWKRFQPNSNQNLTQDSEDEDGDFSEDSSGNSSGQSLSLLDNLSKPELRKVRMMNVFCNPRESEKPIAYGSGKAKIPFFYPKLKIQTLQAGMRTYEIECSSGPVPYMLIFTGMPYNRRMRPKFTECITKTTMNDEKFDIQEFEILVDNYNAFLTPWKAPIQHYTNFLLHNGRYDNKAVGGGLDFFNFQNQNWMVPMLFDDRQGENATINVRITFKHALEQNWDAFVMKIPIDNLILDKTSRGNLSFFLFNNFIFLFSEATIQSIAASLPSKARKRKHGT